MRKIHLFALALGFALATAITGYAQGNAQLTGTVTDPTGAVVPNVTVTATNQATNVTYSTQTTGAGLYRFPALPVGTYAVEIKASGFRAVRVENIVLTAAQVVTEDIRLEVGAITETVTVEGAGVRLVNPEETKVSGLVDHTTITRLPLEIREPSAFVNLMPGTVDGATISSTIGTVSRGPSVHGTRSGMGNFTVDGFDNNDQGQGGRGGSGGSLGAPGAQVGISPEALQEFRVVTSNFEAEHGRGGGFVVENVLRSGTNDLHGSLFEYNRVQKLASQYWASNRAGLEDSLVRNQFGGSIGGPVKLPGYDGRNKTFWFTSVEFHRMRTSGPTSVTSVTPEFVNFVRSGAFADFHESNPAGFCNQFLSADPDDPNEYVFCPGAFNLSRTLGPMAAQLYDTYGLPVPVTDFTPVGGGLYTDGLIYPVNVYGTAYGSDSFLLNQGRMSVKFDHNASDNDRFSFTYLFDDLDQGGSFGGDYFNPAFPYDNPGRNQLAGLTYTRTFSPTVVNEARFGYLRDRADFPETNPPEPPSIGNFIDPFSSGFGLSSALPQYFTNNQFQVKDNISIVYGKHTFKAGGEYRRTRNGSTFGALKNGTFLYNDIESLLTDGAFGDESDIVLFGEPVFGGGLGIAAINPVTGTLPEFYRGFRANEIGIYVQDTWKAHPRLTINLGLRWEYQGPPHNFRPGIDSNFYLGTDLLPGAWRSTANPLCTADGQPFANPFFPCQSGQFRRVANGDFAIRDKNIWAKDTNNFAPRVGFAWDVKGDQKLVFRWGGGVFYDRIWNNLFENIRFNPPYFAFAGTGAFFDGTPVGPISMPGFFSFPINPSLFASSGAASPRHMDENLLMPYVQQGFAGIQYQLTNDMALHVSYHLTQGRKLTGLVDLNTFPGRTLTGTNPDTGLPYRSTRPNSAIGSDNSRTNAFRSVYHGMEATLIKRMSRGLQFQANYTWSKSIDDMSDAFSGKDSLRPSNPLNLALDRGRSDHDITHRFVTSFYYEIPAWRSNRIAGGWDVGGYVTVRTGTPFTIMSNVDSNRDGYFTDRAMFVGTGSPSDLIDNSVSPADGYLRTRDANDQPFFVTTPTDPSINNGLWIDGRLGRNILDSPGFWNVTTTVQKRFQITESAAFRFQANFFNMFNHPNFTRPSQLITSGSFGKSTNTFDPRVIQLALRFDF
jgi:hypothetical protein